MSTATLAGTDKASLKDKVSAAFDSMEAGLESGDEKVEDKKVKEKAPAKTVEAGDNEDETEESEEEETEEEEENSKGDDLSDDELKEAQVLYKALKNPAQAKAVAAALAEQYGVRVGVPETKAEVKEAKRDILTRVKDALGQEYAFMAPKLGAALEAALEVEREERSGEISQLQMQNLITETDTILKTLARETKGESRKLEAKMTALMDEFHPAPGMSTDKYIRGIYKMASSETAKAAGKKEVTNKIAKNAKDLPGRLNAGGGGNAGGGKGEVQQAPKGIKNIVKQQIALMEKE